MLAPLRDRSLIEREAAEDDTRIARLMAENRTLAAALRQARQTQRRNATLAARKIVALTNETSRLNTLLEASRARVAELVSGQAMTEMAQRLMAMSEAKERMAEAARHAWMLDRTLCAAHAECARLAEERDRALQRLMAGRD